MDEFNNVSSLKQIVQYCLWTLAIIAVTLLVSHSKKSKSKTSTAIDDDLNDFPDEIRLKYLNDVRQLADTDADVKISQDEKIPYITYEFEKFETNIMHEKSFSFYKEMSKRRSIRSFSSEPFPLSVLENCIRTAGTAPSGGHTQPWYLYKTMFVLRTFVIVNDPGVKQKIREAAEAEEYLNYTKRMSKEWLQDLARFKTNWIKPTLLKPPISLQVYGIDTNGNRKTHYYFEKSIGIATGMLIAAIQNAGLCTLTHTPTPMSFLSEILQRPKNEKPYLLMPVGYPAPGASVPDLKRKSIEEIMVHFQSSD